MDDHAKEEGVEFIFYIKNSGATGAHGFSNTYVANIQMHKMSSSAAELCKFTLASGPQG